MAAALGYIANSCFKLLGTEEKVNDLFANDDPAEYSIMLLHRRRIAESSKTPE